MQRADRREIVRIVEATYGSGAEVVDVTERLQEHVRNGHLSLTVSNTLFGDPTPNRRKSLRFTYEVLDDIQQYRHEVEENQILSLWGLTTDPAGLDPMQPTKFPKSFEVEREQREFDGREPYCTHLYLDLLKTCLTRYLFDSDQCGFEPAARIEGRDWPPNAETTIGLRRLDNIENCITDVLRQGVTGDFVEAGVGRGGSAIFMRAALKAHAISDRSVWAVDSFEVPTQFTSDRSLAEVEHSHHGPSASLDQVKANFARYNLLDEQVHFVAGQFRDTLPYAPIDQIAILRLDDATYESTIAALQVLYFRLSIGGYVLIDDYGAMPGCKQATDDFRTDHGINEPIKRVDWSGVYWQKCS